MVSHSCDGCLCYDSFTTFTGTRQARSRHHNNGCSDHGLVINGFLKYFHKLKHPSVHSPKRNSLQLVLFIGLETSAASSVQKKQQLRISSNKSICVALNIKLPADNQFVHSHCSHWRLSRVGGRCFWIQLCWGGGRNLKTWSNKIKTIYVARRKQKRKKEKVMSAFWSFVNQWQQQNYRHHGWRSKQVFWIKSSRLWDHHGPRRLSAIQRDRWHRRRKANG